MSCFNIFRGVLQKTSPQLFFSGVKQGQIGPKEAKLFKFKPKIYLESLQSIKKEGVHEYNQKNMHLSFNRIKGLWIIYTVIVATP